MRRFGPIHTRAAFLLLAAVPALAAGPAAAYQVPWSVLGGGATPAGGSAAGGQVVRGTAGQAAVGASAGSARILCHGFWCLGGARVVAVDPPPGGPDLPAELAFGPPQPNPAGRRVAFALALPRAARVTLAIHDLQGRRVALLVDDSLPPGRHRVEWVGEDAAGGDGSGIYFARLLVDGRPLRTHRVVVIR